MKLTPAKIKEAKRLYRSGLNLTETGKRVGCSGSLLARAFEAIGFRRRRAGRPLGIDPSTQELRRDVEFLRDRDMTFKDIGRELGFTKQYAHHLANLKP